MHITEILFKYWVPVIVWSGVIFTFSSIPHLKAPSLGLGFEDKVYHFAEFFIWGILFAKSYKMVSGKQDFSGLVFAVAIGASFAFIDEWHQNWIPGRQFDWKDMLSNWAGLLLSLLISTVGKRG